MSKVNGNNVGIYVDNVLIGCLTSNNVDLAVELIDATCKDNDGARAVLPGGVSGSVPFSGIFETTSTYGLDELVALLLAKTRVGVKQAVSGSGGLYIQGYAYITGLSWTGELNASSTFSGTFEFDGAITQGTAT
jgi:hypothetical protein